MRIGCPRDGGEAIRAAAVGCGQTARAGGGRNGTGQDRGGGAGSPGAMQPSRASGAKILAGRGKAERGPSAGNGDGRNAGPGGIVWL